MFLKVMKPRKCKQEDASPSNDGKVLNIEGLSRSARCVLAREKRELLERQLEQLREQMSSEDEPEEDLPGLQKLPPSEDERRQPFPYEGKHYIEPKISMGTKDMLSLRTDVLNDENWVGWSQETKLI